jgi:hypothetical protein
VKIPGGGAKLHLTVGYIELLDWLLIVKANGDGLLKTVVGSDTAKGGWRDITVDLSKYAGSEIMLELQNASNDASYEIALWTKIQIDSDYKLAEVSFDDVPNQIAGQLKIRELFLSDPHRPIYHFVSFEGRCMPFDPDGAIFWNGKYHLCYIFQDERGHCWGHASTKDLLHWR